MILSLLIDNQVEAFDTVCIQISVPTLMLVGVLDARNPLVLKTYRRQKDGYNV